MSCNLYTLHCEKEINNDILQSIAGPARLFNRDITDKTAENFSGHLMAPDHEFGGIFARS